MMLFSLQQAGKTRPGRIARAALRQSGSAIVLILACVGSPAVAQTDAEVRGLIDRLDANSFADRLAAQETLQGYITNNRLTAAQYGILRTYPAMPTLEQRLRLDAVLQIWTNTFPSVGDAIAGTRGETLPRSVGQDWYFRIGRFYGGANTGDPVVVGYEQRYESARNALTTADTATALTRLTELRNYVLNPMNFDRFYLHSDENLQNRVTREQVAAEFDRAINATQQAIRNINLGSNNVMPPPRQPAPVQQQGAIDLGQTLQLALSSAPVTPGGLDVLLASPGLALSAPPRGHAFASEIFDLRATGGLDVTGSTVSLGIVLAPGTNLSGLEMARLANGRRQVLDDSVIDPRTNTITALYQPESASSGQDQFGEFVAVRPVPEPTTVVMLVSSVPCLLGYGWFLRRRRAARATQRPGLA
jgi:hypothetical protein